jgi:CBS domain containing-hemolysin-like protein
LSDSETHREPDSGGIPRQLIRGAWIAFLVGSGWVLYAATPAGPAVAAGDTTLLWMLLGGLLLCSGLVSSSETALFSLDKLDLSQMSGSRHVGARMAVRLIERPNDLLVTILILNNFINIAVTLTVAALCDRMLTGARAEAFTVAAAASTLSILFVGEILPKMLAHSHPRTGAMLLAPPLTAAALVLRPIRAVLHVVLRVLYRLFRIPENPAVDEVSEEELKVMISSGEVSSVLEEDELEMIDGVFELRHTTIEEILTPRISVVAVPEDLSQEEMVRRLRSSPTHRVLVYRETLDELVGFLLVKEVLLEPEKPWRPHLREPLCVPEQMRLLDLLKTFRRHRMKMAVAVDEYGGVAGIVSLQDVLEEIVGDIYEKHEPVQVRIESRGEDRWSLNGSMSLEDAGAALKIEFPTRRGRTIGGFVMNMLGRIPHVGDRLDHAGLQFQVAEMAGRRVHRLDVQPLDAGGETATTTGEGDDGA